MKWFGGKPKILMVEDLQENHSLFREAFTAAGFDEVMICQTAEDDFVGEVVAFEPSIISMDLMIGSENRDVKRDGFEAIKLLKNDERTKDIPVIVLTSFFDDAKVERAKGLGAVDFINLQGQSLPNIAAQFKSYVDDPKHYKPSHPMFQDQ